MALSRRGGRSRFTLVFLLLTSVTVITLDFRDEGSGVIARVRNGAADALSPVRSAAAAVIDPVGDALAGFTGYGDLQDENASLRARIAELEGEVLRDEGAERELAEALALLDIDFAGDLPRVDARVVSAPVSNFEQTIELDRGSDDGIDVDMPVVTGAGLIGRTVGVSASRSVVQLITDPASSVGVRLSRSSEVAVAEGQGPRALLQLAFVDAAAEVDVLELVVTSGLDESIFPPGIPVGRVASVESAAGQFQKRIEVRPVSDVAGQRLVSVIKTRRSLQ
ncbi:MAG TPA: rod shape-determining protein MreC [Acidimicrobiales bacterium]|nr:rod shape-determining protein MreC [Acidimicrobiales bacterium]